MFLNVVALGVVALLVPCQASQDIPANFSVEWYTQRVDHFSYSNNDVFKQRYIISTDHWSEGKPIFFYAGNEGDIFMFANNTGFLWQNAQQFEAMVVFMEHRYYGESMPYGKKSYQGLANLGYLTVEQALSDFADFIVDLKQSHAGASNSPVVVFGGSYGGMLAAWFRMKYPHIAIGALAASAPILQFPGIYNCSGYYSIATKDFTDYSPKCSDCIRNSWKALRRVAHTADGRAWLSKLFVLCQALQVEEVEKFIGWISNAWDSLAMIDYPNPANFLQPLPAFPVKVACKYLNTPEADDRALITSIYQAVSVYYNYTGQTKCTDFDNQGALGADGWNFQACTEMVLPVCSNGKSDMFEDHPWNLSKYSADCKRNFAVASEAHKALIEFGGKRIESASNIIFSNGLRDPWSAGGVLQTLSSTLIAIQIPGACHHEDLRWTGPNDPEVLKLARQEEIKIIRGWIDDYYRNQFKLSNRV